MPRTLRNNRARVRLRLLQLGCLLAIHVHPLALGIFRILHLFVHVHRCLLLFPLAFPLRAGDLREHLRALLYPAWVQTRLRHLGRELGEGAESCCARERRTVLHRLLRALRDELLLTRRLRLDGFALVVRVKLRNVPVRDTNVMSGARRLTISDSLS